jgi:hypothetical protein
LQAGVKLDGAVLAAYFGAAVEQQRAEFGV